MTTWRLDRTKGRWIPVEPDEDSRFIHQELRDCGISLPRIDPNVVLPMQEKTLFTELKDDKHGLRT